MQGILDWEVQLTDNTSSVYLLGCKCTFRSVNLWLSIAMWLLFLALAFETDPLQRVVVSIGLHFKLPLGRNYHEYYAQEASMPPYFMFDGELPHTMATAAVLIWLLTCLIAAIVSFRRCLTIKDLFIPCIAALLPLWATLLDQKATLETRSAYLTLSSASIWLTLAQSWLNTRRSVLDMPPTDQS